MTWHGLSALVQTDDITLYNHHSRYQSPHTTIAPQVTTYHFSWFVLPLIDEVLKRLFHHIYKLLVLVKTNGDDVIQLVFEVCTTYDNKGEIHFITFAVFNSVTNTT